MIFGLFDSNKPVLPEESTQWLFDAFGWAMRNFGTDAFYQHSQLITPSNRHFPGRETSADGMAHLIFEQVRRHAGVSNWPAQLLNHHDFQGDSALELNIRQVFQAHSQGDSSAKLNFFYEPQQVGNPEAMIANYAHAIAHHLGFLASEPPPCDDDQWLHLMEVVAVYMGFGLMLANTANPYRGGGCGRCRSPAMDRSGYLSETEISYALAIFCVLKNIDPKEVTQNLKPSLKSFFKKAMKDVLNHTQAYATLSTLESPNHVRQLSHE